MSAIPADIFLCSAGVLLAWLQDGQHAAVSECSLIFTSVLLPPPCITSVTTSSHHPSLSFSPSHTRVFAGLTFTKDLSTSGPLHWLYLLPEPLFLEMFKAPSLLGSQLKASSSERSSLNYLIYRAIHRSLAFCPILFFLAFISP